MIKSLNNVPLKELRSNDLVVSGITGACGRLVDPVESDKKWGGSVGKDGYSDWDGLVLQINWDNGNKSVHQQSAYDMIYYLGR